MVGFTHPNIESACLSQQGKAGFVAALTTKRGEKRQFSGSAEYKVVGPRIEFERPDRDRNSAMISLNREEMLELFRPLEQPNCSIPKF